MKTLFSRKDKFVFTPSSESKEVAVEDLSHHSKVIGTASKGVDLSPVACVERGVFSVDYLEQFTEKSIHFKKIQEWKSKQTELCD
jgi:hypothetical protein